MKAMSRELDMERRDCQEKKVLRKRDAKRPKDRDVKRKRKCWKDIGFNRQRWHQKNKSRASELSTRSAVKIQRCQEQTGARLPRDHAVNSPDNQAVRLRSYKALPFLSRLPPFSKLPSLGLPGLYWYIIIIIIYIYIYICYIFISSYIVYPILYIVYYMLYLILYIPYGIHICLFIFI